MILPQLLFTNILLNYYKYTLLKSRRKKNKWRRLTTRPRYYESEIYKKILSKDNRYIREHLRVSADSLDTICEILVEQQPMKGFKFTLRFRVSVFLYWLACGASYRVTGVSFNLSRYSVRTIVHKLLDMFVKLAPKVIKLPSLDSYRTIGEKFNQRSGTSIFSKALGAIDGCHIKILVPTSLHSQYINRKLDYSINLMAVSDSSGRFLNICCGYPGSVHDQRVLRNSQLYRKTSFPPNDYFLLGDSGYKCSLDPIAIITPFIRRGNLTALENKFNQVHSKARSIIENAFGIMKARWRVIFLKSLELNISNCVKVITACCVMHNICINDTFELEPFEEALLNNDQTSEPSDERALEFRRNLLQGLLP